MLLTKLINNRTYIWVGRGKGKNYRLTRTSNPRFGVYMGFTQYVAHLNVPIKLIVTNPLPLSVNLNRAFVVALKVVFSFTYQLLKTLHNGRPKLVPNRVVRRRLFTKVLSLL